jgi:hypothetical protein
MRSLAPKVAAAMVCFSAWVACSSLETPPELNDCLNPAVCLRSVATPAPTGRNVPQGGVDAGAEVAVSDAGIVQTTIPETGPGPGISPSTGGTTIELGPVCPATAPFQGSPCDSIANSLPCTFSRVTCLCVGTWNCF